MALVGKRLKRYVAADTLSLGLVMIVHAEHLLWKVTKHPTFCEEVTDKEKAYVVKRLEAIHDARVQLEKVESRLRHR